MKVGIECEGIFTGMMTLFIEDYNEKTIDILNALEKEPKIVQVYFGATKSKVNYATAEYVATLQTYNPIVTIEVPIDEIGQIPISIFGKVNIMVSIVVPDAFDYLPGLTQVKIQTAKTCYLTTKAQTIKNEINYLDEAILPTA